MTQVTVPTVPDCPGGDRMNRAPVPWRRVASLRRLRRFGNEFLAGAMFVLSATIAVSGSTESDSRLAGHWEGGIALSDSEHVTLVVDLVRLGERWTGEFDVPEYGVENYPVAVTILDDGVNLHFAGPDAEFAGAVSADGALLSGTVHFGGATIPGVLTRTDEALLSPTFLALENAANDPSLVTPLSMGGAELREQFNRDRGKTRLLMLLSPT